MSYTEEFQYDAFSTSATKPSLALVDLDLTSGKFASPKVNNESGRYSNIKAGKVNGMYIAYTSAAQKITTDLAMQDPSQDMVGVRAGVTYEAIGTQKKSGDADYSLDTPFRWDLKFRAVDRTIDSLDDTQLERIFREACSTLYDKSGRFILRDIINGSVTVSTDV